MSEIVSRVKMPAICSGFNEKPTSTEIVAERVDQFERWYALSNIIFVYSPLHFVQTTMWNEREKEKKNIPNVR